MEEQLKALFEINKGYLLAKSIRGNRSLYYHLKSLVEKGEVIQVKRGLYRYDAITLGNSWSEICKALPQGIICHFSAWQYYALTTTVSPVVHVAIPSRKKYHLPDFPPVKLYYWKGQFYETGRTQTIHNGEEIAIYDLEKSVCDAIRFRNKVGTAIFTEVLRNYLKRKDRNLDKLMKYAENMRIATVLNQLIPMLL